MAVFGLALPRPAAIGKLATIVVSLCFATPALADGVIVASPDQRMLYIYGGGDSSSASKAAFDACERAYKSGCKVVEYFGRGCFAFVRAGNTGKLYWALGGGFGTVQEQATEKCTAAGGKSCTVERANCSY